MGNGTRTTVAWRYYLLKWVVRHSNAETTGENICSRAITEKRLEICANKCGIGVGKIRSPLGLWHCYMAVDGTGEGRDDVWKLRAIFPLCHDGYKICLSFHVKNAGFMELIVIAIVPFCKFVHHPDSFRQPLHKSF